MKFLLIPCFLSIFLPSCATYQASVAERDVSGFAKSSGYVGAKYSVIYK